jgi:hypothetical protein
MNILCDVQKKGKLFTTIGYYIKSIRTYVWEAKSQMPTVLHTASLLGLP